MWEKRMVWVVTIWLKETDEEGEPLDWDRPYEEWIALTREDAERMKKAFLAGEDPYYGDLIADAEISDEPEEREIMV